MADPYSQLTDRQLRNVAGNVRYDAIRRSGAVAFTGNQSMGNNKLTNLGAPTVGSDAARLLDVQTASSGLAVKASVRAKTTGVLPACTYNGTTKTLTANANGALPAQDGVSMGEGERLLVTQQATATQNGIYTVTILGGPSQAWVLTRATDFDESADIAPNACCFVQEGTTGADTMWVLVTNAPITLDTTALTFSQFASLASLTAGAGLTQTGNTIDVVAADSSLTIGADNMNVKLKPTGAITLSGDSTGLQVAVDDSTIEISSNALRVKNAGITYAKIQNASAGYTIMAKAGTGAGSYAELAAAAQSVLLRDAGNLAFTAAGNNEVLRRSGSGDLGFGTLVTDNIGASQITYAKIQNVSAQYRVLGRATAGAGVVEEINGLTDSYIAAANKDGAAGVYSMRTLGTGALQAAAGDHAHATTYVALNKLVWHETPAGAINGSNKAFTIANNALEVNSRFVLTVYVNGVPQEWGTGTSKDYTLSDAATIQFTEAPIEGDTIWVQYVKA